MNFEIKDKYDINDLHKIVGILRGENGCPWDKEQNHKSIRNNFIEETYEVIEAIDKNDICLLKEELGDVLLQVMFHSQIEEENANFNFNDVSNDICKKLIIRHPHVFSDVKIKNADDVLDNWSEIKKAQKGQKKTSQTLDCVPRQLPALMRSQKINSRVKKSVFCEKTKQEVFQKLTNEFSEFSNLVNSDDNINLVKRLGDILFLSTNAIRILKHDSEEVLTSSCDNFIKQFTIAEDLAQQSGLSVENISPKMAKEIWEKAVNISIQED